MPVFTLSTKSFATSQRIIETTARPLEIARFRHAFYGGSAECIFRALKEYQNADGGFGRALEPDLRAEESSALCTSIAFQVLRATGARAGYVLASRGIVYLLETLDRESGHWRIIPRSVEKSPHAPWWNQTDPEDRFSCFSLNPTAEILGYLYDYRALVPRDILSLVSDRVISHLSGLEKGEMHELLCCLRLARTETLPKGTRDPLRQKLALLVGGTLACDPTEWEGYSLRPLQVADHPQSPWLAGIEEAVAANLDYEVASQNEDGSWPLTWSWGNAFPEAWRRARREWEGIMTLEKLMLLQRFGRIEGIAM